MRRTCLTILICAVSILLASILIECVTESEYQRQLEKPYLTREDLPEGTEFLVLSKQFHAAVAENWQNFPTLKGSDPNSDQFVDGPLVGKDAVIIGTYTRKLENGESAGHLSPQSFYVCRIDIRNTSRGFGWFNSAPPSVNLNDGFLFAPIDDATIAAAKSKAEEEERIRQAELSQPRSSAPVIVQAPPRPPIELGPTTTIADDYDRYIIGTATNTTNRTFSWVNIEINLYDASGARLGSTGDFVSDLEPGSTWRWKAPIYDSKVTSYKIVNVRAE